MALYIPHSLFHLARLLYVRPETFVPYYVCMSPRFATTVEYVGIRLAGHGAVIRRTEVWAKFWWGSFLENCHFQYREDGSITMRWAVRK